MRVAIIGCGYVGLEMSTQLQANDVTVYGIRRSDEGLNAVEATGARGIQADVTDPESLAAIPSVDTIIYTASSGRGDLEAAQSVYVEGLSNVITQFGERDEPPSRLIYTGSTGVLGDHDGAWVDETTPLSPPSEKARVLARAETVVKEKSREYGIDPLVARLAGIYGPGRYRIDRYLQKPVTPGYRNLIHRDDVAGAVSHILRTGYQHHDVIHIADREPVERQQFATWLASQVGTDPPALMTLEERIAAGDLSETAQARLRSSKRIDSTRLCESGYEFNYPTYKEGFAEPLSQRQ